MINLTIKKRVVILSATLLFLIVCSLVVAGYRMYVIHIYEHEALAALRIEGKFLWLMVCFEKSLMGPHDYLIHGDKNEKLAFEHDIAKCGEALDETRDLIAGEKTKRSPNFEQVMVQLETPLMDLKERLHEFKTRARKILDLKDASINPIAGDYMEAMDSVVAIVQSELEKHTTSLRQLSRIKMNEACDGQAQVNNTLITIGIIGLMFAIPFTYNIARRITRPINHLVATTQELMRGDLGARAVTDLSDEIGELGCHFNAMVEKLVGDQRQVFAIFNGSGDALRVIDKDFNVLVCNSPMKSLTGDDGVKSEGGRCYEQLNCKLCHTDMCPAIRILRGEERVETEVIINTRDGRQIPTDMVSTPLLRQRSIVGVIESFRDISGRKAAEEALRKSHNELEKTLRELKATKSQMLQSEKMAYIGRLAAGIAHEINNPTGFVSSNLYSLGRYHKDINELIGDYRSLVSGLMEAIAVGPDGARVSENLNHIAALEKEIDIDFILDDMPNLIEESIAGTERIKKIVIDLKDFAHPGEDKPKLADINQGLESTLNVVWNELKYKAKVIKEYGEVPPVECYPQQLNQVFMNLLVNAAHAIKKEGEIKIATRKLDGQVEIAISDTGVGIPEENLRSIFDPFFTTKEVGKGTGLGLNVAYNIIKKHKGTIDVESEVGRGTTFIICIPVKWVDDNQLSHNSL